MGDGLAWSQYGGESDGFEGSEEDCGVVETEDGVGSRGLGDGRRNSVSRAVIGTSALEQSLIDVVVDCRVMGHSNGGQGASHLVSHYPDEFVGRERHLPHVSTTSIKTDRVPRQ